MTRFIVHIGDGKCGSSSIQKGLYDAREQLRAMGIVYETTSPGNGHFNLVSLVGKGTRGSTEQARQQAKETIELIRATLKPGNIVLLSAESFFNLEPDRLVDVLRMISPEIDQLDLIAYVRPPHSMYLSLVQQMLKADSRFTMPDKYARRIDQILKCWQIHPEVDRLTVHNFDRKHLVEGDVVADFSSILQGLTGRADIALPGSSENTSLSAEQLITLQQYRERFLKEHDGKAHPESQSIIAYFEKLNRLGVPGSKPVLKERAVLSLQQGNAATVRAVNRLFPALDLQLPQSDGGSDDPGSWDQSGSVAQILQASDEALLQMYKTLVWRRLPRVDKSTIRAACDTLCAHMPEGEVDRLLAETLAFWRQMKFKVRVKILSEMTAPQSTAPEKTETETAKPAPHPMILYGQGDWLFLKSDSNRVLEQIAGTYPLKPGFQQQWATLFEQRAEMARQIGYQYFYGIAPNKECVYADKLPDGINVAEQRPVHKVLNAASGRVNHRYYLDALLAARTGGEDVFVTGDTHWNHLGALVAFNEVMRALGLPNMKKAEFIREAPEIRADLSIKMGQLCRAIVLKVRAPQYWVVEDNKVNNIGHRRVYENSDKTLPSCVYFRDSFTSHQLGMFASKFSRIVFLWQPNIDYDLVRREAPDFVINQQVERFLVKCPDDAGGPSHAQNEHRKRSRS